MRSRFGGFVTAAVLLFCASGAIAQSTIQTPQLARCLGRGTVFREPAERNEWRRLCEGRSPDRGNGTGQLTSLSGVFLRAILSPPLNDALENRPIVFSHVRFVGDVGGEIDLSSLVVPNELSIWDSQISGRLNMARSTWEHIVSFQGSNFEREANFTEAEFKRSLYLGNEPIRDRNRPERDRPEPNVDRRRARDLDFAHVMVGGDLYLKNITLDKLEAAQARVTGNFIVKECTATSIGMAGAIVDQQINIVGCELPSPKEGEWLVTVGNTRIANGLWLNRSTFNGPMNAFGAQITGIVALLGTSATLIDLSNAVISGDIEIGQNKRPNTNETTDTSWRGVAMLSLARARFSGITFVCPCDKERVRQMDDERAERIRKAGHADPFRPTPLRKLEDYWPLHVDLTGAQYSSILSYALDPRDATVNPPQNAPNDSYVALLARQDPFTEEVYGTMADVLRTQGAADKADVVAYAGKVRARQTRWKSAHGFLQTLAAMPSITLSWILDLTIGYGYHMYRSLVPVLVFIIVGALVFRTTAESGAHRMPYGVAYSFDALLPLVKLRKKHEDIDLQGWQRYYFYAHKIAGYVLAVFIAAGLSGLTR